MRCNSCDLPIENCNHDGCNVNHSALLLTIDRTLYLHEFFIKPDFFIQLALILSTAQFRNVSALYGLANSFIGKEMFLPLLIAQQISLISISIISCKPMSYFGWDTSGRQTQKLTDLFLFKLVGKFCDVGWTNNTIFEDWVSRSGYLSLYGSYWPLFSSELQGFFLIIIVIYADYYLCAISYQILIMPDLGFAV